jgi:hypothetical protein
MRLAIAAGFACIVACTGVTPASAGSAGEAACAEFLTRSGKQSLFETVPPPPAVAVTVPGRVIFVGKGKKKKKKILPPTVTMVQPKYVDVQVGCTAASGDGDVGDAASVSAGDANQTLIVDVLSSGDPTGRCDPGPLGSVNSEMSGDRVAGVKLSTTCNYRSFGGTGQGACAKCYQVRVRYENIAQ